MKTCRVCGKSEPEVAFESQRRQCKPCRSEYHHKIKIVWYANNREYAKAKTKEWRDANADRKRSYRKAAYAKNASEAKLASRIYRKNNLAKVNHWSRIRQCAKAQRIPVWLNSEDKWIISEVYDLAKLRTKCTGIAWHVDHIVPLRGKTVSGLHVPLNLQVIPESVNKVKRNYFGEQ
jgi:hypothetical protein